jgi:hypothetical protein
MTLVTLKTHTIAHSAVRPGFNTTLRQQSFTSDKEDGGAYRYRGTAEVKGSPSNTLVARNIRLHDSVTGRLVREQWSMPGTGAFVFERLRKGSFYAVAFDHTGLHNGVIATDIPPEPM